MSKKGWISQIEYENDRSNIRLEIDYDEHGQVAKFDIYQRYLTNPPYEIQATYLFSYEDKKVSYQTSDEWFCTLYLDDENRAVKKEFTMPYEGGDDESFFSHNDKGNLIQTLYEESTYQLIWEQNNVTEVRWMYNGAPVVDKAVYGDVQNKANLDLNAFCALTCTWAWAAVAGQDYAWPLFDYIGTRSTNMATEVIGMPSPSYGQDYTYKFEYETNDEGYPIKITGRINDEEEKFVEYKISYVE